MWALSQTQKILPGTLSKLKISRFEYEQNYSAADAESAVPAESELSLSTKVGDSGSISFGDSSQIETSGNGISSKNSGGAGGQTIISGVYVYSSGTVGSTGIGRSGFGQSRP
jgi:hypothetical protein